MQIVTNQFQKELKKHGNDHFPFLVSHHNLSEYDSNSFMWHCHPEIEITYIKKGAMHYRINNRSFHLKEGEIIFCNSNALHSGEMIDQEDCSYIPVTFDPKLIYGFFRSTICTKYVDPIIQNLSICAPYKYLIRLQLVYNPASDCQDTLLCDLFLINMIFNKTFLTKVLHFCSCGFPDDFFFISRSQRKLQFLMFFCKFYNFRYLYCESDISHFFYIFCFWQHPLFHNAKVQERRVPFPSHKE